MRYRGMLCAALLGLTPVVLTAQQRRTVTDADYAHAERFLNYEANPLVLGDSVHPTWMAGDRFWYANKIVGGHEFVVVDAAHGTRRRAFDHARLAAALSAVSGTTYDSLDLPLKSLDLSRDGKTLVFDVGDHAYRCDLGSYRCATTQRVAAPKNAVLSPDSSKAAFIRDENLWVRDMATGRETQLTTDGVKDFGYATDNSGWTKSDLPILLWSPDSKKIATFQQDERGVGEMYLVQTRLGHPVLHAWKYPFAGDSIITTIQRVIIDLSGPSPRVIRLQMPPDQHRSTDCDDIACGRDRVWSDVYWSPDGSHLAFVSTSRNHQREQLRVADAATGAVRDVMEETSPTFLESGYRSINWRYLPTTNEILWYSNRSNWGHLYLYDLTTGRLKEAVTSGNWDVLQVRRVDAKNRTIYFTGSGREPGDPYFRYFYRVRFDGSHLALLTPDSADHTISLSPSGNYFLDTYSTPTTPPTSVLRRADGKAILTVQKSDISRLVAAGWKPPVPITVKARDGKTDLYGLMYVPTHFDSTAKYPIVAHVYPGPQTGSVRGRTFLAARGDAQALAELGFVVVEIDAMGTPMRSQSFHAAYYGNMGDNGLPDQIAGIKQLAARYPWIDLSRVGIYGHSGGGFETADAMFRYPDFFKVGIAEAGNHDNREYEDDWAERWQGLLVKHPDGTTNYDNQANELIAKNLKGHLLLAYGTGDDNVPPYNTLLVVDSLIKYNKDFDLIALPNRRHGFGNEPYMVRRRWDYFVRYLLGATPPHEYQMHAPAEGRR